MHNKFRNKLLITFAGLVFVALVFSSFAVYQAIKLNIRANAVEQLQVGKRVFLRLLENNNSNLTNQALLLANDFGFKRAIATNEEATILSVLNNHGNRIGAHLLLLLTPDGEISTTTHDISPSHSEIKQTIANQNNEFSTLIVSEGSLYQVVLVPVKAPNLIAWVGLGFMIDNNITEDFKTITKADISFLIHDNISDKINLISTLPSKFTTLKNDATQTTSFSLLLEKLQQSNWASEQVQLLKNDTQKVDLLIATSLTMAYASYRTLFIEIAVITIAALLISIFAVALIGHSITKPIKALVRASTQFANGNYSYNINIDSKNEFGVLAKALKDMRSAIFEREKRIKHQALYDFLTDIPNKVYMSEIIQHRLSEKAPHSEFSLGLIKINNLSKLTDSYGIDWSNKLIRQVAERLQETLRRGDIISRQSTSQFLILYDDVNIKYIGLVADKVISAMQKAFICEDFEVYIKISIGLIVVPEHGNSRDDLLRRAHIALAHCKEENNSYVLYQLGQDEVHLRQIKLTYKLQQAIKEDALELHYQPKFNFQADTTTEVEALLRWNDSEMGPIFPDEFIPIAEKSGFINELTNWVLDTALKQAKVWQDQNIQLNVGVNISAHDLLQDSFVKYIKNKMKEYQLPPNSLVLEITESAMVVEPEKAIDYLKQLREYGIGLSMDDFGTGFSSLWQLKSMPINELKIDKSFVLNLSESAEDQKIVKSTIDLGHNLGHKVIAEGVENIESMQMLIAMGCDAAQGYYLSRPLSATNITAWLKDQPSLKSC